MPCIRDPWLSTAVAATRALTRLDPSADTAAPLTTIGDGSTIATVALDVAADVAAESGAPVLTGEFADVPDAAAAHLVPVPATEFGASARYAVELFGHRVSSRPRPGVDRTRKRCRVRLDRSAAAGSACCPRPRRWRTTCRR